MAQISIIVPVYNVEGFLEDSLRSVLEQTEKDIEVIAVNDGSTDGSLEKLKELAKGDDRIIIIDQPNAGPSAARNAGVAKATSPIIAFMDADDLFRPYTCERILEAFQSEGTSGPDGHEVDILTFGADCFPAEASSPWHEDKLHPRDAIYDPFQPDLVFKESSRPFHWRTAVRSGFLRESGVRFDESLRLGEDQAFHFALYPRAQRTVLLSDVLYDYRVSREGSAMDEATSDRFSMMEDHLRIMEVIFADWKAAGFLERYAPQMAAWTVEFMIYDALCLEDPQRTELLEGARDFLLDYWSADEIAAMDLPKATERILEVVISDRELSDGESRSLRLRYYVQQFGMVSALKSALAKMLGR